MRGTVIFRVFFFKTNKRPGMAWDSIVIFRLFRLQSDNRRPGMAWTDTVIFRLFLCQKQQFRQKNESPGGKQSFGRGKGRGGKYLFAQKGGGKRHKRTSGFPFLTFAGPSVARFACHGGMRATNKYFPPPFSADKDKAKTRHAQERCLGVSQRAILL